MLYDNDGTTVNMKLVQMELAVAANRNEPPPSCLSYPSFNMLERLVVYPTYAERFWMLSNFGIDFNGFEENNIPQLTNTFAFENELNKLLNNENFAAIKSTFLKLIR